LTSSTAATLSFSQRSPAKLAKLFALAITLAWTMMFVRIEPDGECGHGGGLAHDCFGGGVEHGR
jgi:hypothetical protein